MTISPAELLAQLLDTVERLAAPVSEQRAWAEANDYPIEELILELDLEWPLWQARLVGAGVVDADGQAALDRLREYALPLVDPSHEELFSWEAVAGAPEWKRVRELAAGAAARLRTGPRAR